MSKIEGDQKIYDMDLHRQVDLWRGMSVIRVPGGWIYQQYEESGVGGYEVSMVFVPFSNELQMAPAPNQPNT